MDKIVQHPLITITTIVYYTIYAFAGYWIVDTALVDAVLSNPERL
jgi:hypothetical protein